MRPSEECKEAGLTSLKELEAITGIKERTLINWHREKPKAFKALLLGAVQIKQEEEMKFYIYDTKTNEVIAVISGNSNQECENKAEDMGYMNSDFGGTYCDMSSEETQETIIINI